MRYTVLLYREPDVGGYSVVVPALPGCYSQGDTVEEALTHAREAIEGHVATLAAAGDDVPLDEPPPVVTVVDVATATPAASPRSIPRS